MVKNLKDCKIGDNVILWCTGWNSWDNDIVEVVDNGVSILTKVKYKSGKMSEFSQYAKCKLAN